MNNLQCESYKPIYSAIFATGLMNEFGCGTNIPWNVPEDMKYFREKTKNSIVISGYNTGRDILLKDRFVIVITDQTTSTPTLIPLHEYIESSLKSTRISVNSIETAINISEYICNNLDKYSYIKHRKVFFIGGAKIFKTISQTCYINLLSYVYYNQIGDMYIKNKCDTYFDPNLLKRNMICLSSNLLTKEVLSFVFYKNVEELSYLNLLEKIAYTGIPQVNRTGVKTFTSLNEKLSFDLSTGLFPLMTHRKIFLRGIFEELRWFLMGDTNTKSLSERNVHIWDGNSSRDFLDKRGLVNYEEGDIGPGYGWLWRHFGGDYVSANNEYNGIGFDQIQYVIDQLKESIKTGVYSRRIVLSAWDPSMLDKTALPPCHLLYIWNIIDNKLHCSMTMRSADLVLGVPFNIASTSILTILLAKEVGISVGTVSLYMVNCHVYENHIPNVYEMLQHKITHPFPKLIIDESLSILKPEELDYKKINLIDYVSEKKVKFDMVV